MKRSEASPLRINASAAAPRQSVAALLVWLAPLAGVVTADEAAIDFNRDVRPILSDKCYFCHGPAEDSREADLRLDVRDEAIDYGAIEPGDPEASLLVERIDSDDEDYVMPPPRSRKSLSDKEKATLRRWIASGVEYAKHWSFNALPREVSAPPEDGWSRTPVDRFVLRRLRRAGLEPNGEADRRTWLRRVTFDLTGLPPTLDEIEAFLADKSDDAYERVVDRLLATDAYAERMTSEWLDVARYSDSYGYQRDDERFVWPYRDWVVRSFKRNQPYDEFVTWQVAGDLLPEATREQRLATTFCRLHSHKKEGGVAVEEFRVENVADRTHTFASAFLGLTMECARCHDHKFDPITMRDYYSLSSFFANIDERGLISYFTDATPTPAMPLPNAEQESRLADAEKAVEAAEGRYETAIRAAEGRFDEWLGRVESAEIEPLGLVAHVKFDQRVDDAPEELFFDENTGFVEVEKRKVDRSKYIAFKNELSDERPAICAKANRVAQGVDGDGVELTGDDSIVIPGVAHIERHEPVSVSVWIRPAETPERAVIFRRSGGWDDSGSIGYALVQRGERLRANAVHFWPGNAICVETDEVLRPDEWRHVTVTYDGSREASGLRIYVDGERADTRVVQDSLTRTITGWRGGYNDLAIGSRYRDRGFKGGVVDDFRVYDRALTAIEVRSALGGGSAADRDELFEYFVAAVDDETRSAWTNLQEARRAWDEIMDEVPSITIMREQPTPRPAYVLERGAYDSHGDEVSAGTPAALPEFPDAEERSRLGLARWLFDSDHPLTARVTVNRYWQMVFGAGLVRTPEDFGSQGEPPSHPELLDWLARDFVDSGWDVRRMLRMLVLSATYRQDSAVSPEIRERDPENRLLSRAPAKQLSAEMIRDNALAVSGLLNRRVGGPPVKPYDLPLAYTPVDADTGEGLYRRSLYTFWKRTSPSPVMMTMNANRREVCLLRRDIVSSPLQALVLLNGTQFIEASRAYAQRLLADHGDDSAALIAEAFQTLTTRPPTPDEAGILASGYRDQIAEFEARPELAAELVAVGASAPEDEKSPSRLAATTVLVNSIMNLDESVRRR